MKVTIITTCFNRADSIGQTIESVMTQDYHDIEYIVVDGASTDGSVAIIESYKNIITHFISEPDKGMYEAVNKGIRLATGDIIGLLHSDDIFYDNQVISRIALDFELYKPELLYGNGLYVSKHNPDRVVRNWISGELTPAHLALGWLPLHTTVYCSRESLMKYGLYDESYKIASDSEFLVRYLYTHKVKTFYHNRYVVRMKMGGASTTLSKSFYKWKEDAEMFKTHGISPTIALPYKISSKLKQFLLASKPFIRKE